ncbi:MAG TPA: hypothetical protein VM241_06100 [Candidatus Thermoplasmatota archaeon]|nr:hypothetical protein [Candidatus Thermoplasmatota archaeon]
MDTHRTRIPAAALASLLLAFSLPSAHAVADCASASVPAPPACAFACESGQTLRVTASSASGGEVRGEATCPTTAAGCQGVAACSGEGPPGDASGVGVCAGWAANGDGVVVCGGGSATGFTLPPALDCGGVATLNQEVRDHTVLFVSRDPAVVGQSYSWTRDTGCVRLLPRCHLGDRDSSRGIVCGVGRFDWTASGS